MSTEFAILTSAVLAAFAALQTLSVHNLHMRKQKSIDILLKLRTDSDFLRNQQTFREYAGTNESTRFERIVNPTSKGDLEDKLSIQNYLNTYELLAVSIRELVIDEKVCKELIGDALVKRWEEAKPLVDTIRSIDENNTYFTELEYVATHWKDNKYCIDHHPVYLTLKASLSNCIKTKDKS